MQSLQQDAVIHEIDPVTEIEFPPPPATAQSGEDQPAPAVLAGLQLLWDKRGMLSRVAAWAFVISTVICARRAFNRPWLYD